MTQVFQSVHPNSAFQELINGRFTGFSMKELKFSLEAVYGPFPLLFDVAQREGHGHTGPGLIVTGLIEMPGAPDREKAGVPFLGAAMMGYCPAVGHEGAAVRQIGVVKGARWDEFIKPPPNIDPRVGSAPGELARTAEPMEQP